MTDNFTEDPSSEANIVQGILDSSGENVDATNQADPSIFDTNLFDDSAIPDVPQAQAPPITPQGGSPPVDSVAVAAPPPPPLPTAPVAPPAPTATEQLEHIQPLELSEPMEDGPVMEQESSEPDPFAEAPEIEQQSAPDPVPESAPVVAPTESAPSKSVDDLGAADDDIKVVSPDDFGSLGVSTPAKPAKAIPAAEPPVTEQSKATPEPASTFDEEASDESIDSLVEHLTVDEDMKPAGEKLEGKAAKAKDGPEAIAQARAIVEQFDGEGDGFIDAAELKAAVKLGKELDKRLAAIEKQMVKITNALSNKQIL